MAEDTKRMKELVDRLGEAAKAYYQQDRELMSNQEYDALYDALLELEKRTGVVLADSPTVQVGYEAVDELPKEAHESKMLSLDKTKDREVLRSFIGERKTLLSWKLDGLTVVLTYQNGALQKAVTRGNGTIGEVVTNNARVFKNIPLQIPCKEEVILRGEALICYSDFERINREIPDVDARYKNPRNLCSGSVRQLNNKITAQRSVRFYAFSLVKAEGVDFKNSREEQMKWLVQQGFETVEYRCVTADTLDTAMDYFEEQVRENDFPSDGLVALYDDIAYGESLGTTAKFPRNAFAFKWADEKRTTKLLAIEWSPSRTGLINPVAIFEPVELEGTTVSRASVHNLSILKELELGIGDEIDVFKANMIIPQIAENHTRSAALEIPKCCPACQGKTAVQKVNEVETLICTNPDCPAKAMKSFELFVSRDALNIEGLSGATLEKFVDCGFIREFADIFQLERHREEILQMEGFGEKSWNNLQKSIQKARHTTLARVIYGLGIPNIGVANAKMLCKAFSYQLEELQNADEERLSEIDGIGSVIAAGIRNYFSNEQNKKRLETLISFLEIEAVAEEGAALAGLQFVVTGSVNHFPNRSALKAKVEEAGGKVTASVTSKTSYLINNDSSSNSSKNKKAKELGVPIITEEEFLKLLER